MSDNKKSFLLYIDSLDVVDEMSVEQKAELFQAIIDYNKGKEPILTGLMKAIFVQFKNQFERDAIKYEIVKGKRSLAGKQGGRPKKEEESSEEEKAKKANAFSEKQTKAKKAVNVNDNVTDTVNVNDNVTVINNSHDQFLEKLLMNEFLGEKEAIEISCRILIDRKLLENFNANLKICNKNHIHWSEYLKHLRNWINTKPPDKAITSNGHTSKFDQAIESHKGAEKLLGI